MINRLVNGGGAFEAHGVFVPAMLTQLYNEQMVVMARDKPFVTLECSEQVFRRLAHLDPVAGPNLNCLRLSHSPQVQWKDRLGVKDAFQDRCDVSRLMTNSRSNSAAESLTHLAELAGTP